MTIEPPAGKPAPAAPGPGQGQGIADDGHPAGGAPGAEPGPGRPTGPGDFESFYRREYSGVVALAFALCGRRAVSEDLAQEAFLAAHQRWDKVSAYDQPGAYVRRLVANAAISAGRRWAAEGRALRRLAVRSGRAAEALEPPDAAFWAAVRRLAPHQAQAISLYYLEDRTAAEIAAVLGCSASTVAVHLHRGRVALEKSLNEEVGHHGASS